MLDDALKLSLKQRARGHADAINNSIEADAEAQQLVYWFDHLSPTEMRAVFQRLAT